METDVDTESQFVSNSEEQAKREHTLRLLQIRFRNWLAAYIVTGFFGIIVAVLLGALDVKDPTVTGLVGMIIGNVQGITGMVIGSIYQQRVAVERRQDNLSADEFRRANDPKVTK